MQDQVSDLAVAARPDGRARFLYQDRRSTHRLDDHLRHRLLEVESTPWTLRVALAARLHPGQSLTDLLLELMLPALLIPLE